MAEPQDEIEMVVESVRVHMLSSRHVVILKEAGRERFLPIWIGPWEASAIAMRLQGMSPERPLTHDLFASTLGEVGVEVVRVVIASLAEETYHARLIVRARDRQIEIDARPSDALALAVRLGTPIFAVSAVLEQAGLGGETGDEARATPEGLTPGEADPRLDVFREFVNSLEPGPDSEREGPSNS